MKQQKNRLHSSVIYTHYLSRVSFLTFASLSLSLSLFLLGSLPLHPFLFASFFPFPLSILTSSLYRGGEQVWVEVTAFAANRLNQETFFFKFDKKKLSSFLFKIQQFTFSFLFFFSTRQAWMQWKKIPYPNNLSFSFHSICLFFFHSLLSFYFFFYFFSFSFLCCFFFHFFICFSFSLFSFFF